MHKRPSALASILAVAATAVALGMPAGHAAPAAPKTQKVKTTVSLTKVNPNNIDAVKFTGRVKSKKPVCRKGRTVKLRQLDQKLNAGKAKTNKKGVWKITFNGNRIDPGKFRMTVTKKVVKKGGKRIVCQAAKKTQSVTG